MPINPLCLRLNFPDTPARSIPSLHGPLLPVESGWKESAKRQAAVAFLFIPSPSPEDPLRLVLTKRSMNLSSHKGQIAFAGGRRDQQDRSPACTAARETEEETGLSQSGLTALAQLPTVISIDGSEVTPVIMTGLFEENDFKINPKEVDHLILAEWTSFTAKQKQKFSFPWKGKERTSYLFEYQDFKVWGLTALMISNARLGT